MCKRAAIAVVTILLLAFGFTWSHASAAQGQPVLAGELNTSTDATWFFNTSASSGCGVGGFFAVVACGGVYGEADGTDIAVSARHATAGGVAIRGEAKDGGTGVKGVTTGTTGIGVWGQVPGTGSAVYGEATGTGVGVYGDTVNGTGVTARSTNGTALNVNGKAKFSRSGTVTIAAGTSSRTVTLAGVTTASMVLVTAQQNATVFAKAAVPASGSFTIRLTGSAPSTGLKVAYFVLN
jgi:hypothetical protein